MQTIAHNVKVTMLKDRSAKLLMTAVPTQSHRMPEKEGSHKKRAFVVQNTGNLIQRQSVLEQAAL
jgi:hypothetical protein